MVSVTQAHRGTFAEPSSTVTRYLQPIDEMFMFLNYLALGLKQHDLADRFGVHQSTVSRIITTWSNFLYAVLGVCENLDARGKNKGTSVSRVQGLYSYSYPRLHRAEVPMPIITSSSK